MIFGMKYLLKELTKEEIYEINKKTNKKILNTVERILNDENVKSIAYSEKITLGAVYKRIRIYKNKLENKIKENMREKGE